MNIITMEREQKELYALWNAYIEADMEVHERDKQIKEADYVFKDACIKRDAAWEKYRALKAQLGIV